MDQPHRRLCCEQLEGRRLFNSDPRLTPPGEGTVEDREPAAAAVSSFVPPEMLVTDDNPVQSVRVVVLNFDPTVPSEGNKKLREVFHWNDPRQLTEGFINDVETASGHAFDYEIVEWRDLNEFPVFTDGFRYTADDYVQKRRNNSGLVDTPADFYAIANEQGLAELVNENVIDEIWMFGDHYFNLLGEAWMAGPQSFFINGPSFPEFAVDRAVAGFGFNYERGVAEMLHNLGHRTENHMARAYTGRWDIANPVTPWDLFTANAGQTNRTSYGVGSVHFPMNARSDYDYNNRRSFPSYADDFVTHFPDQIYQTETITRDAWGDLDAGDWHRGYLQWFFGHLPRQTGTAADGRQNNWYKYIFDFNAYRPNSGLPRDNEAIIGAAPIRDLGETSYEFTLRFYDVQGIDVNTLDDSDVLVTGPNGYGQMATLVEVGESLPTTAGVALSVRYRITPPGGSWDFEDSGSYSVRLRSNQVFDLAGNSVKASEPVSFEVEIANPDFCVIDVASLLVTGQASVTATPSDIGSTATIFDGRRDTLYRTPNIDPAVITLALDEPHEITGTRVLVSHAWGDPAYRWKVETADTLDDLQSGSNSYRLLVPPTGTPSDVYSSAELATPAVARYVRLTVERLTGDDYVHINEWQLYGKVHEPPAPGDFDGNGLLDSVDLELLAEEVARGTHSPAFDLTDDGTVDRADVDRWLLYAGSGPGDANLDGQVNFDDFVALAANYGQPGTWSQGDFDVNGQVEFADFVLLAEHFGKTGKRSS